MQTAKNGFSISTDKGLLDISFIHSFLTNSYWAEGIPVETVRKSIDNSLCFGLYEGTRQIGFARMITDQATFAYLADVFIDEKYRGRGLSKWLVEVILQHPGLQGLRRLLLATRDAHGLYSQFGFEPLNLPERWMQVHHPGVYKKSQ